jgi:hypothetical protein
MTLTSRRPEASGQAPGQAPGQFHAASRGPDADIPVAAVQAVLLASTKAVPGVRHVSIGVLERGGAPRTLAATGPLARRLDEIQRALGEGPAIDAVHGPVPVVMLDRDELEHAVRWPEVSTWAASLGLTAAVAVRLAWEGRTLGVLTLSSDDGEPMPERTVELATAFAAHAAATIAIARKVGQLELAMVTRQEIGQAMGILMERHGLTAESAFAYLRRLSQNGNVKLRDLAAQLRLTGRLPDGDRSPLCPTTSDAVQRGRERPQLPTRDHR